MGYMNPSSVMTRLPDMAAGPGTGFLAGLRDRMGEDMLAQEMQSNQVDTDIKKQALDEATKGQSDRLAELAYKGAKATADKADVDSGLYGQDTQAKFKKDISDSDTKVVENQDKQRLIGANMWAQFGQQLKELTGGSGQLDWKNPTHRAFYQQWKQDLSQFAPGMPDWPDPRDGQNFISNGEKAQQYAQIAMSRASAAVNTPKQLGEERLHTMDAKAAMERQQSSNTAAMDRAVYTHDADNAARVETAQIRAKAAIEKQQNAIKYKDFFDNQVTAIKANGGVKSDTDANTVDMWADAVARVQLSRDENMQMMALTRPDVYEAAVQQKAEQAKSTIPGYDEYQLKKDVGGSDKKKPEAAAKAPAGKAPPAVGFIKNGFKFKGGDPAKKENWEPAK